MLKGGGEGGVVSVSHEVASINAAARRPHHTAGDAARGSAPAVALWGLLLVATLVGLQVVMSHL